MSATFLGMEEKGRVMMEEERQKKDDGPNAPVLCEREIKRHTTTDPFFRPKF